MRGFLFFYLTALLGIGTGGAVESVWGNLPIPATFFAAVGVGIPVAAVMWLLAWADCGEEE